MRSLIFVAILALMPWVVFGLVKEISCSQTRTQLLLSCPSSKTILIHSLESQKDPVCQNPPDERKWTREDPSYLWIFCNLRSYGSCRRSIPRRTFVRVNYTCVTLTSLRTIDMCSNLQKVGRTPFYIHSPGYVGSGLFYYDWTTNCTCRLSPVGLPVNSVYNFTLSMHDSLAATPDGPSLRWGKKLENHFEDLGEYTKITLTNISSDMFIYFEPESKKLGWFWIHIDSTSVVTFRIACNGALGYPIPPLATAKLTSPTPTTTTTTTTTTTMRTTTREAKATTPSSSSYPLPTTKPQGGSDPESPLANQGGRQKVSPPPAADGSHDELKNILIGTTAFPWLIILVIVVVVVVIVVRRVRKREGPATTTNHPIQHVRMGQPIQIGHPGQMNGGIQARPISELNIYSEPDNYDLATGGFNNPVYQNAQELPEKH